MKIYVGNLSFSVTEEDLKTMFTEFGEIENVKLIVNNYTGQSKGFGFIEMPDNSEADKAIKALNKKLIDQLGGLEEESQMGKHLWKFIILPKIPLKIIFYDADEEFPVDIQIMLDKTALQFLEFECLAFMVGCFVRALIKTAQYGDVVGWEQ